MYVKTLYFIDQWDKFKPIQMNCHLFYEIGSEISWRGLKKKLPFKYYTYQVKTGPYLNSLISNSLNI